MSWSEAYRTLRQENAVNKPRDEYDVILADARTIEALQTALEDAIRAMGAHGLYAAADRAKAALEQSKA